MALLDFITSKNPADVERRLRLAQAMSGMSLRPNTGLQSAIQGRLQGIQEQRKQQTAADLLTKQSAMAQQLLGSKFPMLSGALKAGIISPQDAIKAARQGGDAKVVGKALVAPDGTVIYRDETAGDDKTTAFQTLHQKAIAGGLTEGTPKYQQFMLEGGAKKGMALTIGPDGTIQFSEGGATPINLTEGQGKASAFYQRSIEASKDIDKYETEGLEFRGALLGTIPFTNILQTEDYQKYSRAKDDWIAATLRDESGAAIGKDEYDRFDKIFFPQVGDKEGTVAAKKMARKVAEQAILFKTGQSAEQIIGDFLPTVGPSVKNQQPTTTIDQAISDLEGK